MFWMSLVAFVANIMIIVEKSARWMSRVYRKKKLAGAQTNVTIESKIRKIRVQQCFLFSRIILSLLAFGIISYFLWDFSAEPLTRRSAAMLVVALAILLGFPSSRED
jgi:hypothetical protein